MMEATASTEPSAFGPICPASVSTMEAAAAGPATIAMPQTPASHDMATVCSEAGTTGMAARHRDDAVNKPIASRAATAQQRTARGQRAAERRTKQAALDDGLAAATVENAEVERDTARPAMNADMIHPAKANGPPVVGDPIYPRGRRRG